MNSGRRHVAQLFDYYYYYYYYDHYHITRPKPIRVRGVGNAWGSQNYAFQ